MERLHVHAVAVPMKGADDEKFHFVMLVSVTDSNGVAVTGLTKGDFKFCFTAEREKEKPR